MLVDAFAITPPLRHLIATRCCLPIFRLPPLSLLDYAVC